MHAIPVLFGILGGLALGHVIRRHRHGRMAHGCGHFGHFAHGPFGHFSHGPFGHGRRLFFLYRELALDPAQREEVKTLILKLRGAFGGLRFGALGRMSDLVDAATAEPLDRARLDELAAQHAEAHSQVARDVVQAITRLSEILRPEQRAKLGAFLKRAGACGDGAGLHDHPYR